MELSLIFTNEDYKNSLTSFFSVLVGIIFLIAAFLKLFEPEGFYISLTYSNFIGSTLGWVLMYIVPFIELIIGFSLLVGYKRFYISILATFALTIFSIYLIFDSIWGSGICGCFGSFDLEWPLWLDLVRNILLIIFLIKYKFGLGIIIISLIIVCIMILSADFKFN